MTRWGGRTWLRVLSSCLIALTLLYLIYVVATLDVTSESRSFLYREQARYTLGCPSSSVVRRLVEQDWSTETEGNGASTWAVVPTKADPTRGQKLYNVSDVARANADTAGSGVLYTTALDPTQRALVDEAYQRHGRNRQPSFRVTSRLVPSTSASPVTAACDGKLGRALMDQYRHNPWIELCQPIREEAMSYKPSRILCKQIDQGTGLSDPDDLVCVLQDIHMDMMRWRPSRVWSHGIQWYSQEGTFQTAGCVVTQAMDSLRKKGMARGLLDEVLRNVLTFETADALYNNSLSRHHSVQPVYLEVPSTILLVRRDQYTNIWHALGALVNDWLSLCALYGDAECMSLPRVTVVFTDSHPPSPVDGYWQLLFGDLYHLHELTQLNTESDDKSDLRTVLRASRLVISLPWVRSTLMENWQSGPASRCGRSAVVRNFRRFALMRMALLSDDDDTDTDRTGTSGSGPDPIRITVISRSSARTRHIDNMQEVVASIHAHFGPTHVNVSVVDFQAYPSVVEQARVMYESTDIVVGTHGAGLAQLLFLPDRSTRRKSVGVLEIFPCIAARGFSEAPVCYENLAQWIDVRYQSIHLDAGCERGERSGPESASFTSFHVDIPALSTTGNLVISPWTPFSWGYHSVWLC